MSKDDCRRARQNVIYVNHEPVPVSQEIADFDRKYRQNRRYYARRDGKCGTGNYHVCGGDCYRCRWHQKGYNMLPLTTVFGEFGERETPDFTNIENSMEETVLDRFTWPIFYEQLDKVIPNGALVFRLRAAKFSQREIAKTLGGLAQTTLNYRIKKLDAYIKSHADEIKQLLF